MDAWEELDVLVEELMAGNEEWGKSAEALQQQLAGFAELTAEIDGHFDGLGVYDALLQLCSRALHDAGRLHQSRLNYGLTRSAALLWPSMDDPRRDLASAPPEAMYTVEVRIGPRYLLGVERDQGASGDQRLSMLIAGEKQLVATLPTTAEKFRGALLRAFAAPHYSGPPREAEDAPEPPAGPEDESAAEATAEGQPADGGTPSAAPTDRAGGTGEEQAAEAPSAESRKGSGSGRKRRKPAAADEAGADRGGRPVEDDTDVIHLPGAGEPG